METREDRGAARSVASTASKAECVTFHGASTEVRCLSDGQPPTFSLVGLDDQDSCYPLGAPFVTIAPRTYAGTVSIFHSAMTGVSTSAARVLEGPITDDRFGNVVASAGDVNRNGFGDVLVGSGGPTLGAMTYTGRASVFHGAATGVATSATFQVVGQADSCFSHAASGAGDVNGDGFADIIVGAFNWMPSFRPRTGSAFVFHGATLGVSSAPARSIEGAALGDGVGGAVAHAGARDGGRSTQLRCASPQPRYGVRATAPTEGSR
jgi:hypothetical protein